MQCMGFTVIPTTAIENLYKVILNSCEPERDHVVHTAPWSWHRRLSALSVMSTLTVRHAWLQMPSLKRKAEDDSPAPRKRIQSLERSLAHMTLTQGQVTGTRLGSPDNLATDCAEPAVRDESMEDSECVPSTAGGARIAFSSSRSHPLSEDVPMVRRTWYEPEKDRT
jgi:hypothetical protein